MLKNDNTIPSGVSVNTPENASIVATLDHQDEDFILSVSCVASIIIPFSLGCFPLSYYSGQFVVQNRDRNSTMQMNIPCALLGILI